MKNINELLDYIKQDYNIYLSNGSNDKEDILKKYLPACKGIPPIKSTYSKKNLVIVFLTTIYDIEPEITFSHNYKIKDHRSPGNENDDPCITVFVKFFGVKFDKQFKEFCECLSR